MTIYQRYRLRKGLILAFHGCDQATAVAVASGQQQLIPSRNPYDWLGHGIYFWENNPERALEWAQSSSKVKTPAILGAIIDLGHCLDLTESVGCDEVGAIHQLLSQIESQFSKPKIKANSGKTADKLLRHRDCAVINFLHEMRQIKDMPNYASVRAAFHEGGPLYENAGFSRRAHIQLCICDTSSILGYFLPRP